MFGFQQQKFQGCQGQGKTVGLDHQKQTHNLELSERKFTITMINSALIKRVDHIQEKMVNTGRVMETLPKCHKKYYKSKTL